MTRIINDGVDMKSILRLSTFAWLVLLTIANGSNGGEVGKVVGRLISSGVSGPIHLVSLVNDRVRMDGEVEKDSSFILINVPPGRYLVVVERGLLVLSEVDVLPDLTTSLIIDFHKYYLQAMGAIPSQGLVEWLPINAKDKNEHMLQVGDAIYPRITLKFPPLIHHDKTFSGYVILGEEELRERRKSLKLDTKKFGKMYGYGYSP